jgi:SAM-dependent methyltransferase
MESYRGRFAELYDLFYSDKAYEAEVEFVCWCLGRFSTRSVTSILDVACGTGEHAKYFAHRGLQVTGIDHSQSMVKIARKKCPPAQFHVGDMRTFDLAGEQFDAGSCLFDSIGYVRTNEGVRAAFSRISQYLRSEGILVFEFWHAPAMLRFYEPLRVRWVDAEASRILRISNTTLDVARHLAEVRYTLIELGNDGNYQRLDETQTNRFFMLGEMEELISESGLELLQFFSGFSKDAQIDERTWHVVGVARRT